MKKWNLTLTQRCKYIFFCSKQYKKSSRIQVISEEARKMTTPTTETTVMDNGKRYTGMVKWFNNKAGFGFITVCGDNEYSKKDIFVHYSSIRVTNSQYKYLVQGEYVDFTLMKTPSDKHEYHATDITGVMQGNIMCETRRLNAALNDRNQGSMDGSRSGPPMDDDAGFVKVKPRGPRTTGPRTSRPRTSGSKPVKPV
jgi:cold shock CspA family protein